MGRVSAGSVSSSGAAGPSRTRSFSRARCALILTALGDNPRIAATSRGGRPSAAIIVMISWSTGESSESAAASALSSGSDGVYQCSAAVASALVVAVRLRLTFVCLAGDVSGDTEEPGTGLVPGGDARAGLPGDPVALR